MARRLREMIAKTCISRRRRALALLAAVFLFLTLLILALPTLLTLAPVQSRIRSTLGALLHAKVDWNRLQISWSEGLRLDELRVGPGSGTLRAARITKIICNPGFGFGAHEGESFGLDLLLELREVDLELAPPPVAAEPVAAAPVTDPLSALATALEQFAAASWPLPVDLRLDLAVEPLRLRYHDPGSGRSLLFERTALRLKMPSLERAPIEFGVSGTSSADGHPLGDFRLASQISGLVAPSGRIVPAGALLALSAELPGATVQAGGRVDQGDGLKAQLRLDLAQLAVLVAPFSPEPLPQLGGSLSADLHVQIDREQNLALQATVAGRELAARGAPFSAAGLGPLDCDFSQRISTDHRRQLVTFGDGRLGVPGLLTARWSAAVERPSVPEERAVAARLERLELDLDRAVALAAPFLPQGLPRLRGGRIELQDLGLRLQGAKGEGEATLGRAILTLAELSLATPPGALSVAGIEFSAAELRLPLVAYLPAGVAARFSWKLGRLQSSGAQPFTVQALSGEGELTLRDLAPAPQGLAGLAGSGDFTHRLRCERAELAPLAVIRETANELRLAFTLPPAGGATLEELAVETRIGALEAQVAGQQLAPLPLSQSLHLAGVQIAPGTLPTLSRAELRLAAPGLVEVTAQGALASNRKLALTTGLRLDLGRLAATCRPLLPEGLAASGRLVSDWQLVATLPAQGLSTAQNPLRTVRSALSLAPTLDGTVQFDQIALRLPLAGAPPLHLAGVSTPQPLRLHSDAAAEQLVVAGELAFELPDGFAVAGQSLPAQRGSLALRGELNGWERCFFGETLRLEPLGLTQRSELSIERLAALLDAPFPPTAATLLQRLDAILFSEVGVLLPAPAPPLVAGFGVTGRALAGARVDLVAGRSLRLRAYADADGLNLALAPATRIAGVQAHLDFERSLRIITPATPPRSRPPLSTSLVQPLPAAPFAPPEELVRRLRDDLRGNGGAQRSLAIADLSTILAGHPLAVRAIEGELLTGSGELGLNFFQAELLGGTVRARALVDLRPALPVLAADGIFTNLDLARLGVESAADAPGDATTSLSGELTLRLPLAGERRELLEGVRLQGTLRKIGSRTFDHALAQLDPFERNEAIVAQRKLLRHGQVNAVSVKAADGGLSLSGQVATGGATIDLPRVERLRLAELPLAAETAQLLAAIATARRALDFARADTLSIGPQGELSLLKEE